MRYIIPFLGLLILGGPPSWASSRKILPVHEDSLANGLKVLICEKRDVPVVSIQVWYRVGSRNESPGLTGISHFLEHMMFKGRGAPGQFNDEIQKKGGRANAFTSDDYTCYHEEIAREHWEYVLSLEAQRMVGLQIDSLEFETERQVVLEERRLRENSPTSMLFEELDAAAYQHHPYGWPILGYTQDIEAITLEDLKKHYRTFYRPDNAVCVIVGDIDHCQALAAVAKHFGSIAKPDSPLPLMARIEPSQRGERRVKLNMPSHNSFLAIAFHTVEIGHGDSYTLDVLSTALSDGESSRLHRRLVRELGLAAYAGGYNRTRIDPTIFTFYAAPAVGRSLEDLEAAILGELAEIKVNGLAAWELDKAKNQIESSLIFSRQRAYSLGIQLGSAETMLSWRYWENYLERISSVSNEDIIRVASRYFTPVNQTEAVLIPEQPSSVGAKP